MIPYLLIFGPVFLIGAAIGWGLCQWRHAARIIVEAGHAADDQPVPYWPTVKATAIRQGPPVSGDLEWQRILRATREDGL